MKNNNRNESLDAMEYLSQFDPKHLTQITQMLGETIVASGEKAFKNDDELQATLAMLGPEDRELLQAKASFVGLWQYFDEHQEELPPEVVEELESLPNLSIAEQTLIFRSINQRLLGLIGNANQSA